MKQSDSEQAIDPTLRIYELTTLYEVSRVLLGSSSPEHLAFDVLTATMGLTGSTWGILWTAADDRGTLHCMRTCGHMVFSTDPVTLPTDWATLLADRSQPVLWEEIKEAGSDEESLFTSPAPDWLHSVEPDLILPLSEQ